MVAPSRPTFTPTASSLRTRTLSAATTLPLAGVLTRHWNPVAAPDRPPPRSASCGSLCQPHPYPHHAGTAPVQGLHIALTATCPAATIGPVATCAATGTFSRTALGNRAVVLTVINSNLNSASNSQVAVRSPAPASPTAPSCSRSMEPPPRASPSPAETASAAPSSSPATLSPTRYASYSYLQASPCPAQRAPASIDTHHLGRHQLRSGPLGPSLPITLCNSDARPAAQSPRHRGRPSGG
jgi:hypothetical protein